MPGTYPGFKWRNKPPQGYGLDPSNPIAAGLKLFWPFNEPSAGTAFDLGPRKDNGSVVAGTVARVGGPYGAALSLTSGGAIGNGTVINLPRVTIAGRAMIPTLPGAASKVAGFADGNGSGAFDKVIFLDSSNHLQSYAYDGSTQATASTSGPAAGKWFSYAATADGSNLRIYLDGVQVGSVACGNTFTGYSNTHTFFVGGSDSSHAALNVVHDWGGAWDHALTPAQVASLARDPYALILAPAARRFFAPPAGGGVSGSGAGTTGTVAGSGSGSASESGSGAGTLRHVTGSLAGSQADAGAGAGTTGRVTASGSGSQVDAGSGSPSTGRVAGSGSGASGDHASGSGTLGLVAGSGSGTQLDAGTGAGTTGKVTASGSSTPANPASGSGTTGKVSGSLAGSETDPGSAAGTLGRVAGAAAGSQLDAGSGAGTLGHVTGSGSSTPMDPGTGAGTTGHVSGSASGSQLDAGSGAGTVGRVSGSGSGSGSPVTAAGIYWTNSYFAATYFAPTYWPGVTTAVAAATIADPDETVFRLVAAVPAPWETVFERPPAGPNPWETLFVLV